MEEGILILLLLSIPCMAIAAFVISLVHSGRIRELQQKVSELERKQLATPAPEPEPEPVDEPEPSPQPEPPVSTPQNAAPEPEPAPVTIPEPPPRKPAFEWAEFLQKIHLLPPSDEGTTEVRLASWWTTRIGILLGVIAAVFFGVYVSEHISPWVRLLQLTAVGVGLCVLGLKLEKKLESFAHILSAGGLVILYVAGFASYAFKPLAITESPALGLVFQILGILLITGWSVWKKSEPLATTAILLGYVSCWFSHRHGVNSFTLVGLILFALPAAWFLFARSWKAPLLVALAGSYGGFVLLVQFRWLESESTLSAPLMIGAVLLLLFLFHGGVLATHLLREKLPNSWRMSTVLTNTSLATAALLFGMFRIHPELVEGAYLALAVSFLALAGVELRGPGFRPLITILFLKATAALACFFVARFDGAPEWLALAVQGVILAFSLSYYKSRWMDGAVQILWLVAAGFLVVDLWTENMGMELPRARLISAILFVLLQGTTLSLLRLRWNQEEDEIPPSQIHLLFIFSVANGAILAFLFLIPEMTMSNMALCMATAVGLAAGAAGLRTWPLFVTAGTGLALSTLALFSLFGSELSEAAWGTEILLTLFAMYLAIGELLRRFWPENLDSKRIYVTFRTLTFGMGACVLLFLLRISTETEGAERLLWIALAVLLTCAWLYVHTRVRNEISERGPQNALAIIYGVLLAGCSLGRELWPLSFTQSLPDPYPAFAACALLASVLFIRRSVVVLTAGIPFLASYLGQIRALTDPPMIAEMNPISLIILTVLPLALVVVQWRFAPADWKFGRVAEALLHASWILSLSVLFWKIQEPAVSVVIGCALTLGLTVASRHLPLRMLTHFALLPAAISGLWALFAADDLDDSVLIWLAPLFVAAAWLLDQRLRKEDESSLRETGFGILTVFYLLFVSMVTLDDSWISSGLALSGLALVAAGRFLHLNHAEKFSLVPLFLAAITGFLWRVFSWHSEVFPLLVTAFSLLAAAVLLHRKPEKYPALADWVFPICGMVLGFLAVAWEGVSTHSFATAAWGGMGVLIFLAGFGFRIRAHRILGLIGLGFCVLRLFLVDLSEPFHRIIAFGVLAVLLLVIGFLYTRFREFIERDEEP